MALDGQSERSTKPVIWVLSQEQAHDLVQLGAALDQWLKEDSPANVALVKLDEQTAAQMRNPYDEAEDELRDRLAYTMDQHQFDSLPFDVLARAVVDRVLGIYS